MQSVDNAFAEIKKTWGGLDFVVHALAFSDRRELQGRYSDTTRDNFTNTMVISCFSFTEVAKRAAALMPNGGSMLTLTYGGSQRVVPSYNVMGVAKAALEASVRYLAADFGPQGIRVNALSAGPMRTLAGAGISDARTIFNFQGEHAPLKRTPTLDEVGGAGLYLLSDLSGAVTGEVHYVDCGYNAVSMPSLEALKTQEQARRGRRPACVPGRGVTLTGLLDCTTAPAVASGAMIGVFDSGHGGLTVFRALVAALSAHRLRLSRRPRQRALRRPAPPTRSWR